MGSAESKCNCVLQGKPPSDEHLLKLCTDVLRSKYLLVLFHFSENRKEKARVLRLIYNDLTNRGEKNHKLDPVDK